MIVIPLLTLLICTECSPLTSSPQPDVVHRFWWNVEAEHCELPAVCLPFLQSFQGVKQIIWSYNQLEKPDVSNVVVRDAGNVLPLKLAKYLIEGSIDVRLIKDLFSFLVIAQHGHLFTDFDYFGIGRALPTINDYIFGCEPTKMLPKTRCPS